MNKFLFLIFFYFLCSSTIANAGIDEAGSGNWCQLYNKGIKLAEENQKNKIKKNKKYSMIYAACETDGVAYQSYFGNNLEKLKKKTYKKCMKNAKEYNLKDCYIFSLNGEVLWQKKYDWDKGAKRAKLLADKADKEEKLINEKDMKLGRFIEDQPDVNDDYQIHFIYMLAADGKDREFDINGKIEKYAYKMNKLHEKYSKKVKGSSGAKKYKYDYREDGKLDITFIRLDKKRKKFHKYINNNYKGWLWLNGFNNPKKHYFTFADVTSPDGGEGGVGMSSVFLKSKYNRKVVNMVATAVHELHHGMGGGFACVPGMSGKAHWIGNRQDTIEKQIFMGKAYVHDEEGCPKGEDSAFLTPTSKDPYDPFKFTCLNEWTKYNHPKLVNAREKQAQELTKGKRTKGGGSSCKFSYWDNNSGEIKLFNDQEAKSAYQREQSN